MVDAIVERTLNGQDKNGRSFKAYSKAYKKSDVFDIYGKSNQVNLKLTGEMQAAIDVFLTGRNEVTVAFNDSQQNDKASGHVNGTFSSKGKRQLPVRDFWGLDEASQYKILKGVLSDFNSNAVTEFVGNPNPPEPIP